MPGNTAEWTPNKQESVTLPKIEAADIERVAPPEGGAVVIFQRHEKYIRDPESPNLGGIDDEAKNRASKLGESIVSDMLDSLGKNQNEDLQIMFVSSDTRYKNKGQRSMQTAEAMKAGVLRALEARGLTHNQILNLNEGFNLKTQEEDGPGSSRPNPNIREPKIFWEDEGWEFAKYIAEQEKTEVGSQPFFLAFESDKYKDKRLEMGVEGPHEMADRLQRHLEMLSRYSRMYHSREGSAGKRLVIIDVSHYDLLSPFIKDKVMQMSEKESNNAFLPVDYGGGISITLSQDNEKLTSATTTIKGAQYQIPLERQGY